MTVKQLVCKLNKMPEDATITVSNNGLWINGTYTATKVVYWKQDNTVEIDTDYQHRLETKHDS